MKLKHKVILTLISLFFSVGIVYSIWDMSDKDARNIFVSFVTIGVLLGYSFLMSVVWEKNKK